MARAQTRRSISVPGALHQRIRLHCAILETPVAQWATQILAAAVASDERRARPAPAPPTPADPVPLRRPPARPVAPAVRGEERPAVVLPRAPRERPRGSEALHGGSVVEVQREGGVVLW